MASIVKRGTKFAVVYYEGEGNTKHQVWKSGLSLKEAEAFKSQKDAEDKQRRDQERTEKQARQTHESKTKPEQICGNARERLGGEDGFQVFFGSGTDHKPLQFHANVFLANIK